MDKIINQVIRELKDNKQTLNKIHNQDNEVYKVEFDIDKLINLIKQYKTKKLLNNKNSRVLISHYGNPYITALLCVESLLNSTNLTIEIDEFAYGLNKAIIEIFNNILEKNKINLICNIRSEELSFDEIICLGNTNAFSYYKKYENARFVPLFGIALYYDSEDYEELVENIRQYAEKNFFEIEIFDATDNIEDTIYMMNSIENNYCAVILSKDDKKQGIFKEKLDFEIVVFNENPFKKFWIF